MFRTITPFFSIILAIAIYFFFSSDIFAEMKLLEAETKEYNEAIANGKQYNQKLESALNTKRAINALEAERINALVSTDVDEVRLLVDLTEIARSHNMLLGNISVEEGESVSDIPAEDMSSNVVTASDFVETSITFGLIGTYEQFKDILADIEKSLTLLEITNIEFAANEGDLQQFNVTVRTFALRPSV